MKIEYTPERGRGFVRPGETGKPQNWGFSGIKKAAPKWSRLSEQITRCALCVYDPKHKHGMIAAIRLVGNAISLVQFVAIPAMGAFPCTL